MSSMDHTGAGAPSRPDDLSETVASLINFSSDETALETGVTAHSPDQKGECWAGAQSLTTRHRAEFRETKAGFKAPAGTQGALLGLKSPKGGHQTLEPRAQESPPGGGKCSGNALEPPLCSKPRPLRSIPDKSIGRCPMTNSSRRRTSQRSKTNQLLFGPADAAATEEPVPPSLSGHDHSLDFRNIRATRACNTVKITIADLFLAV
ncbi:unnamed protein product [Pleuronectes platessa]|uniref:Uncharacterized protein n=1 Tax=Pleuronectes platessa TaxID=8262 RepID=A0A9N7VR88_PLEPL|nr:unnamed protein product [Pleuronectes platessa]